MNNKIIVLTGPTAVGKTALSIKLAHKIGGEIISADSVQVYKDLDIGSAKITKDQTEGINHYLIDVLDPKEEFNVFKFKNMALSAMDQIYKNNHIPIVVGGTGFYIQALLYDINFEKEDNSTIRQQLVKRAEEIGSEALYEELKAIDPVYASGVHHNNVKRVIRALEYYEINHRPFSEHNEEESMRKSPYDFNYFVLTDERNVIYDNINKRVDIMINDGLVNEVKALLDKGLDKSYNSMISLGYSQIIDYIKGEISLEEAVEKIKLETRHFAKRQLTWFRREKEVTFINKSDFEHNDELILEYILKEIGYYD